MLTDRYPYSPIIRRKPFRWPNGARIALMVAPNIECFHIDKVIPGAPSSYLPDVTGYALRDYGARIGVFRVMEVLDKHTIRASVLLNADVCVHYPAIIEEGNKRNWEWLGHGVTNNIRMTQYAADEERAVVRQIRETITAVTGKAPRGWLGPGLAETFDTPDLLAEEGIEYISDWVTDDQPYEIKTTSRPLVMVPYSVELNDVPMMLIQHHRAEELFDRTRDQFDRLYEEGEASARIMAIAVHPYVTGVPHRIKYFEAIYDYMKKKPGVLFWKGEDIHDWYRSHAR